MPRQARPRGPIELLLYPVVNLILLIHSAFTAVGRIPLSLNAMAKKENAFFSPWGVTQSILHYLANLISSRQWMQKRPDLT